MENKEIKLFIDKSIEELFKKIVDNFNLKSGDVTPLQDRQIEDFKLLLIEYINNNIKKVL